MNVGAKIFDECDEQIVEQNEQYQVTIIGQCYASNIQDSITNPVNEVTFTMNFYPSIKDLITGPFLQNYILHHAKCIMVKINGERTFYPQSSIYLVDFSGNLPTYNLWLNSPLPYFFIPMIIRGTCADISIQVFNDQY